MSIQLKMKLAGKQATPDQAQVSYTLQAVSGPENQPWSRFTPSGKLEFTVTNPDCPQLDAGDYLVTLERALPE
jgi:hypothetical protein